jgi:hypothetical protein
MKNNAMPGSVTNLPAASFTKRIRARAMSPVSLPSVSNAHIWIHTQTHIAQHAHTQHAHTQHAHTHVARMRALACARTHTYDDLV